MKKIFALCLTLSLSILLTGYASVAAASTYGYIANSDDNTVTLCTEDGSGGFDICSDSGVSTSFDEPIGIAIPNQTFSGNNYAYIVNGDNNTVSKCHINTADGTFYDPCADSGVGDTVFNAPISIAFKSSDSVLYAYITELGNKDVKKCTVNASTGNFSACVDTIVPVDLNYPFAMVIQTINGIDYAYVPYSDGIMQCTVSSHSSGQLTNCISSGVTVYTHSIAFFQATDLYAYIGTSFNQVSRCNVDPITGLLSACTTEASGILVPAGIAFVTLGSDTYAYITSEEADGEYTLCSVNSDTGAFSGCAVENIPINDIESEGMSFYSVNGVDYVYAANPGLSTVSQCTINKVSGVLFCVDSGLGDSVFTEPRGILLQEVDSTIYAYVPDSGASIIWLCSVDSTTGQLNNDCRPEGGVIPHSSSLPSVFSNPTGITFATMDSVLYAYISDTGTSTVFRCIVDTSNGGLYACHDASGGDYTFDTPEGLAFLADDYNFLYIVENGAENLWVCSFDLGTGLFELCFVVADDSILTDPHYIQIAFQYDYTFFYIPDGTGGNVQVFEPSGDGVLYVGPSDIGGDGFLGIASSGEYGGRHYAYIAKGDTILSCVTTYEGYVIGTCLPTVTGAGPEAVTIQTLESNTFLYLGVLGGGGLIACVVPSDGVLDSCVNTIDDVSFYGPEVIVFQTIGDDNYAYILDTYNANDQYVTQCLQDPTTGMLSACVNAGAAVDFSQPNGLAFDTVDGDLYAYLPQIETSSVLQCLVDPSTGLFEAESCSDESSVVETPLGLGFFGEFAYVTDAINNRIMMCDASSGQFESCQDSGAGIIFQEPVDISFFLDEDDNTHAYITNADNSDCVPPYNSVTFCAVDSDTGLLSACNDSTVGAAFSQPVGIAFSSSSSYAYVTNSDSSNNKVSKCSLNPDGSFDLCGDSGVGAMYFDKPFGITFFALP